MKENKKKNVLSGALGAAAGVAGAVGASELNDWLKENEENDELADELDDDAVAVNVLDEDDEEDSIDDDIVDTPIAQNPDSDEIMPVDSGGMGQIGENEVAMIDVNPDEIAQEIIGEPIDDENLLASHDGTEIAPDGDIDALFDEEETDPVVDDEELAGTEYEEVEEFDELDEDVADSEADADEDIMDDMVDDIG